MVSVFIVINLVYDEVYSQSDADLHLLQIGDRIIEVEFANNGTTVRRGLTGREDLPKDQGMLLMTPSEEFLFLEMEDTYIPLSVGFFNAERQLLEVQEMYPDILVVTPIRRLDISNPLIEGSSEVQERYSLVVTPRRRLYVSGHPCQYALEMNQGWFERNNIKTGTRFEFEVDQKTFDGLFLETNGI